MCSAGRDPSARVVTMDDDVFHPFSRCMVERVDAEMAQALEHPIAHQVVTDAADRERLQAHLGGGDGGGAGRSGNRERQFVERIATASRRDCGEGPAQAVERVEPHRHVIVRRLRHSTVLVSQCSAEGVLRPLRVAPRKLARADISCRKQVQGVID